MKYLSFLSSLLYCIVYSNDVAAQSVSVHLSISNVPKGKGTLMVAWFNKKENFLDPNKTCYRHMTNIENKSNIVIVFPSIETGEYAISMFFDENNNGVLDTNFLGIPTEKYGFSNNKYFATRATTFEEAKFKVLQNNQTIAIKFK